MYAVITGASSGIGEQFAKRLAKEGYDLILVARRRERLTALSDKLKATHKELECDIFTADLMQLDECQRLSDYLEEKDIEIFINNAGYGDCGLFEETDIAKEMGMIDVNVRAVHFLTKKLLRQMRVKDRGFILNVASSAGLIPAGPYMAAYYASKAYVASLSRAVACVPGNRLGPGGGVPDRQRVQPLWGPGHRGGVFVHPDRRPADRPVPQSLDRGPAAGGVQYGAGGGRAGL